MKYIVLMIKGFIIGVAKIIPGVSGAIIAITFGVYERLVSIISKPLKISLGDLKFLFFLLIGAALGIGGLCKVVKWCLNVCYLPTMLLFAGLIFGGMPEIVKKIKHNDLNWKMTLVFIVCFVLTYYLITIKAVDSNIFQSDFLYFLIGIIESATTIIPGISGTAIFMALGWYDILLTIFEEMANFSIDITILFAFLSGFITSTIMIAKLITWLFKKHGVLSYTGVLAFMSVSLIIMLEDTFSYGFSIFEFILGIFLFIFGCFITKKINAFFSKF